MASKLFRFNISERKGHRGSFSSRCIFDIYCFYPSGVHPTVFSSLVTHTCTHHHTTKLGQHYSFSTNYSCFLDMVPKNTKKDAPEFSIKTVTDPDPGPSFISFTTKWKRRGRSAFQDSCTPLLRTLKQSPSLGLFKGRVETKQTEGETGSGRARGQAQ